MGFFTHDRDKPLPLKDTSFSAWSTVVWAMCCNMASLGLLYAFGVFVVPMSQDFGVGVGAVSWIASIAFVCGFALGLPSGMVGQHFGAHNCIMAAGVLMLLGMVASSYATTLWVLFISYGVVLGVGVSFAVISSQACVISWFHKRAGVSIGLATAGSGIGNLIAPLLAQTLMRTDDGVDQDWRNSVLILGLICGSLMFLSGVFIRQRPDDATWPTQRKDVDVDEDVGASTKKLAAGEPDEDVELSDIESLTAVENSEGTAGAAGSPREDGPLPSSSSEESDSDSEDGGTPTKAKGRRRQRHREGKGAGSPGSGSPTKKEDGPIVAALRWAWGTTFYKTLLASSVLLSFSMNIPVIHLPGFAENEGESPDRAAALLSMLGGAQIAGRISWGLIADRIGAVNAFLIGTVVLGVITILWTTVPYSYAWVTFFAIVYGFNLGTLVMMPATMLGEHFPGINVSPLLGFYFTCGATSGLLGPTVAGYVFDGTGTYFANGFLAGAPLLASLFLLVPIRRLHLAELRSRSAAKEIEMSPVASQASSSSTTGSSKDASVKTPPASNSATARDEEPSYSISETVVTRNGEEATTPAVAIELNGYSR